MQSNVGYHAQNDAGSQRRSIYVVALTNWYRALQETKC